MRILLAEDDRKIARHLSEGLQEEGYVVDMAQDGDEALWLARHNAYDLLVLDVMMPGKDGLGVIRQIRRSGKETPSIFITAKGEIRDRVAGLDAGADDYLIKPFSLEELLARMRALLRRNRPQLSNTIRVADLELDLLSRTVRRGVRQIELTNREFSLLEFLASSSPRPVSKTAIVEHVWDQYFDSGTNVVNVYIKYLREKIEAPGETPLLHTIRGVGFVLKPMEP